MEPFSVYKNHDRIKRVYIADLRVKNGFRGGQEMLREDMDNPKYEHDRIRTRNRFWNSRGRPQTYWTTHDDGVVKVRGKRTVNNNTFASQPLTHWIEPSAEDHGDTVAGKQTEAGIDSIRRKARIQAFPERDPIRHIELRSAPDTQEQAFRERQNDRLWGTLGIPRIGPPSGSEGNPLIPAPAAHTGLTDTPRGRARVFNDETCTIRDPIHGSEKEEPAATALRGNTKHNCSTAEYGVTGPRRGKNNVPLTHGVYDPIQNRWIVPPKDKRLEEGLTWKPLGVFTTYGRTS